MCVWRLEAATLRRLGVERFLAGLGFQGSNVVPVQLVSRADGLCQWPLPMLVVKVGALGYTEVGFVLKDSCPDELLGRQASESGGTC